MFHLSDRVSVEPVCGRGRNREQGGRGFRCQMERRGVGRGHVLRAALGRGDQTGKTQTPSETRGSQARSGNVSRNRGSREARCRDSGGLPDNRRRVGPSKSGTKPRDNTAPGLSSRIGLVSVLRKVAT